jgi:hypothetical protein
VLAPLSIAASWPRKSDAKTTPDEKTPPEPSADA